MITAPVKGGEWCLHRIPQSPEHCLVLFYDPTGTMLWQHPEAMPWKPAAALVLRMHRALLRDHGAVLKLAAQIMTQPQPQA